MSSTQTRLAQGAARDGELKWREHAGRCPACYRVVNRHRNAEPCAAGAKLRNEATALRKTARDGARLDKQVPEGQDPLF
jgi:hypothetical protein